MPTAPILSQEEHARIAEAVARAEEKTSAEIRVAVSTTPLVGHTHHVALWAALVAQVLPWLVILLVPMPTLRLLAVQAVAFILLCGILAIPSVARGLVPRREKRMAAQVLARQVFLAHGLHQTQARTGILILVAPEERLVEVVADTGVHEALGAVAWQRICDAVSAKAADGALGEGIVQGVTLAGELLAAPMPARPGDRNEVPDRVVML